MGEMEATTGTSKGRKGSTPHVKQLSDNHLKKELAFHGWKERRDSSGEDV